MSEGIRSVSEAELARLLSPEPTPAPAPIPAPDEGAEADELRFAYLDDLAATANSQRLIVRVDANTQAVGGTLLRATTLGAARRSVDIFVPEGCDLRGSQFPVGQTLLAHLIVDEPRSPDAPGATRLHHGLLGGALPSLLEARVLADDAVEVSFPWGREVLRATELGGVL